MSHPALLMCPSSSTLSFLQMSIKKITKSEKFLKGFKSALHLKQPQFISLLGLEPLSSLKEFLSHFGTESLQQISLITYWSVLAKA